MKRYIYAVALGLFSSSVMAADMSSVVGQKVDAVSNTAKSTTDKTATPVEGVAQAAGLQETSKKVNKTAKKTKAKTDKTATSVKKAVGAADATTSETMKVVPQEKTVIIEEAEKVNNASKK
jgi:hypothetical protein